MDTQLVTVRAHDQSGMVRFDIPDPGYISGRDPLTGVPYVWYIGQPQEVVIPLSVLAELEADPRLEVRRVDPRLQAAKRMDLALAADKEATAAETHAKQLRAKADMLFEEAQRSQDAAGSDPLPKVSLGTPGRDAMLASLPADVRKDAEKIDPEKFAQEMLKPAVQRRAEQVISNSEYEKAVAQAFPNNKAAQEEALTNSHVGRAAIKKAK